MIHRAWSSIEEVPYYFSRPSITFQGHTRQKIVDFDPYSAFLDCNSSFNSPMVCNDIQTWSSIAKALYCFSSIRQISRSHATKKIADYDPNWAFPDGNSNLNLLMALKWRTQLDVIWKRCPIDFQGYSINFKVTRAEKTRIWIQFQVRLLGRSQLSNSLDFPC